MKKLLLLLILLASCSTTGHQPGVPRNEREARFMEFIDSTVISNNFTFRPQSFRQLPAGRSRRISNLSYGVEFRTNFIRIFLPYYSGIAPRQHVRIMNSTLVSVNDYTVVRDNRSLTVRFSSNFVGTSGGRHTFTLTISRTAGTAILEIRSPFGITTSYNGSVFAVF